MYNEMFDMKVYKLQVSGIIDLISNILNIAHLTLLVKNDIVSINVHTFNERWWLLWCNNLNVN